MLVTFIHRPSVVRLIDAVHLKHDGPDLTQEGITRETHDDILSIRIVVHLDVGIATKVSVGFGFGYVRGVFGFENELLGAKRRWSVIQSAPPGISAWGGEGKLVMFFCIRYWNITILVTLTGEKVGPQRIQNRIT